MGHTQYQQSRGSLSFHYNIPSQERDPGDGRNARRNEQLFRHSVREQQGIQYWFRPFRSIITFRARARAQARGEPLTDPPILVVNALPPLVVPRRRELVVNTKWLGSIFLDLFDNAKKKKQEANNKKNFGVLWGTV